MENFTTTNLLYTNPLRVIHQLRLNWLVDVGIRGNDFRITNLMIAGLILFV